MNDWYALMNDLDTEETPLDEMTQARIVGRAKAALPRRRKKRWVAAAVAAVLVLSACGVAVATGQFSHWFWNYSQDPQAPEASEDLLAGLGTVIGQSRTVDGTTITLDGALWDGHSLVLSLTVDSEALPRNYMASVRSNDSWLLPPREKMEQSLREQYPDMAEEELQAFLDRLRESSRAWNGRMDMEYLHKRDSEVCQLQLGQQRSIRDGERSTELVLHLENLEITDDCTIAGPFEFTFTVEAKNTERVYTGGVVIQTPGGYDCRVTKVTVSPFRVKAEFEMLEPIPEDADLFHEVEMGPLLVGGEEAGISSRHGGLFEDDLVHGYVHRGPFKKVVDPAAVEAVQIGGVWVELRRMTLAEAPGA